MSINPTGDEDTIVNYTMLQLVQEKQVNMVSVDIMQKDIKKKEDGLWHTV